jgi:CMP-N-acetylneuraminic acid synthetase
MNTRYNSVGIIPFKEVSTRVPEKNFRDLAGAPLYKHIIRKALASNLDKVFVCTNSSKAQEEAKKMGAEITDYVEGTGDKLIYLPSKKINSKIYVQLFATAPFLRSETINEAIKILEQNKEYDSVFTIKKRHEWAWYRGSPITYYPGNLPRSQDAHPLQIESTGLYAITNKALKEYKRRVGNKPYMLEIDLIEGWDIDEPLEFKIAEAFIKDIDQIQAISGKDYGIRPK